MSTPPAAAAPITVVAIHHQPVPGTLTPVQTPVSMTSSFIVTASTPATLSYANSASASFSPSSLSSTSLSGSKSSPSAVAFVPQTAAAMNGTAVGTGSNNGTTCSGGGATSGKDSGWLTLEVCREHVRQRCTRSDNECRFAHPPPHVDIQNGRVVCCFDSIKGRCQRIEPPCKYLHPPQHLKEQLLQNGRNNLIMKNLQQISRIHQHNGVANAAAAAAVLPTATAFIPMVNPYLLVNQSNCYASYYNANTVPTSGSNGCVSIVPAVATPTASVAPPSDQPVHELESGSSGSAVDVCTYSAVQTTTVGNHHHHQQQQQQAQGTQQYWTLSPSGGATMYAANPLATPYFSHCSPVYYQNGSYAIPAAATTGPAGTTMLLAKRTPMAGGTAGVPVTANGLIEGCGGSKNGYLPSAAAAVYGPCSTAAYQQMALSAGHIDLQSCYPMAITVPPPVNGFYGC